MHIYICRIAACLGAAILLAMPAVASAEIRQGKAIDPTGDSAGAPSQDVVSATAQYDTNGSIRVTATMNGDITSGPRSFFSFDVKSYAAPDQCTGSYVSMFGFSDSEYNLVLVQGVSGTGNGVITRSGPTIGFGAGGSALRDRDYSCMTLSVSRGGENETGIVDQLNIPLFFDGYGPDTDGDGLKDNQDQCVSIGGPAPTGCPVAISPPPGAKCVPPRLKGKSLASARKALKKRNCKLGRITKPKQRRKGAKLVVKRQAGKGPVNVWLRVKRTTR